jgi:tRNA (cmo5U34)-methyltransferase
LNKATIEEIKNRFDNDVEEFSNLIFGQTSVIDAKISLNLVAEVTKIIVPKAINLLDIGCGAGNYTLAVLLKMPNLKCTLVDLSESMLSKALERVSEKTKREVKTIQGDIRTVRLKENHFDIILSCAVLHHLRDDKDWESVFIKLYNLLNIGGCLIISDFVTHDNDLLTEYMMRRYISYLEKIENRKYAQEIFNCIEKNDTPRSITYQLDIMKKIGFRNLEILHKNICFGTFCATK